jgi:hypothetical protein
VTTKLKLYNKALKHLSTVRLANLTENNKARFELDAVYDDTLQACLEKGLWKHAKRTVMMEADTDTEQNFGYAYAYPFPSDYVRTFAFCDDENLTHEVEEYLEENNVWYTNSAVVYLSYVSNGPTYGLDLGKYTENYAEYVGAQLALDSSLPITRDKVTRNDLLTISSNFLKISKRLDAVDEPIKRQPQGRLVSARSGFGPGRVGFRNGRMTFGS